jgi:hypothetical protein
LGTKGAPQIVRTASGIEKGRSPEELLKQLQKAELLNDPFLAKACLVQGYRLGNSTVVGRYLDVYPDERVFWDEFSEAAERLNEFERAMNTFSAPSRLKPLEHYLS